MEFYTEYNRPEKPTTPSGEPTIGIFQERYNKKGKLYLEKVGEKNVYNEIQASAKECDIYEILDRAIQTGDTATLNKRQTFYGDFRNIPSTPIEMQNMIMKAEKDFYSIDKDVRELFNNDVGEFKASIMTGTFDEKMQKFFKSKEPKPATPTENNTQGVNLNE